MATVARQNRIHRVDEGAVGLELAGEPTVQMYIVVTLGDGSQRLP